MQKPGNKIGRHKKSNIGAQYLHVPLYLVDTYDK